MALIVKPVTENTYRKVIESVFFTFSGIFVGIALNDLWRLFDLPGNKQVSEYSNLTQDEVYQYAIAGAIAASSLLYPLSDKHSNNLFLGIGTAIGVRWANGTERGEPIQIIK